MTPETPATPAVRAAREAEEAAEQELTDTTIIYGKALAAGGSESLVALMAWELARDKHRDAVAARVTEELLASGTPLWVATDGGPDSDPLFRMSAVFQREPRRLSTGDWHDSGDYGLMLPVALTPPGTVHQVVLLMKPEETR